MGRHGVNCFGKVSSCPCLGLFSPCVDSMHICINTLCTNYILAPIGISVGAEERVRGSLKYKWRTGHSTPSPAALRQKS